MKKLFTLIALLSVLSVSCTEDMLDNFKDISDQDQPTNNDNQIPHNQIWYTNGSTTMPTEPCIISAFGANIISNTYDAEKECWVITFDGSVTTIGDHAFAGCDSLTSVTIGDNVTTIGNYAFALCSSLTSVTIPDSVTTIGNYAFYDCSSLTSVTIPDSVTTIGGGAFQGCSSLTKFKGKFVSEDERCLIINGVLNSFAPAGLTEYTIPDGVTTIGENALFDCSNLTSITIPGSVTTIGDNAFTYCSSLTSVTIPDSVTTIGGGAFQGCSSLTKFKGKFVSEDERCLIINGVLNSFAPAGLTEYTIPDSVTTIGNYAFDDCSSLTSVTIPDSVTTIGNSAFAWCSSLTSVNIPDSVTTIGEGAFCECINLTSITIPPSVTTIGSAAFRGCSSLTEFNGKFASDDKRCLIVDGTINSFAPAGITEYTIPNDVITIGNQGFACCSSIKSITIPDNVTTIDWWAFTCCPNLMNVIIEDGVTTIGYGVFMECRSLASVYCKATTPPAGEYHMFLDNAYGRKIYVPMESVEAYKSALYWSEYANAIEGYNF